jgi:hypothetical protein
MTKGSYILMPDSTGKGVFIRMDDISSTRMSIRNSGKVPIRIHIEEIKLKLKKVKQK